MTPSYIETIENLASQFPVRAVTLYFPDFDAEPPAGCLNQVFGAPVGVTADNWPTYSGLPELMRQSGTVDFEPGDLRMEHICTIDLKQLPTLRPPPGARALQLYMSSAGYNEAWEPGTPHTQVAFLGEDDLAAGPFTGELPQRSRTKEARRFTLVPVAVPSAVFGSSDREGPLGELRKAIYGAPARFGGEPIWLQGDPDESADYDGGDYEDEDGEEEEDGEGDADEGDADEQPATRPLGIRGGGGFYGQFDEEFVDVNLGDCGIMYVFGDDAHWQCH